MKGRLALIRRADDAGASLIELMVTMGIMGALMVVFTASVLQMYRGANATEAMSVVQAEIQLAFQRLDKEIRYATWLNQPGAVTRSGQDWWYAEFARVDPQSGQPQCGQLRLAPDGVLQLLRWTPGAPPAEGTPGQTLASSVVTEAGLLASAPVFALQRPGDQPYATAAAGASYTPDFQRLRLRLTARVGTGQDARTMFSDVTFTALNTSRDTPATNTCSEGRP